MNTHALKDDTVIARDAGARFLSSEWRSDPVPELAPWLEIVADASAISFFNWDVRGDRLTWNRGSEERMGLLTGTVGSLGQWRRFVARDDAARVTAAAAALIADGASSLHFQYRWHPPCGRTRIMEGAGQCVYDRHGQLDRLIGAVRDVTESVENARDLRRLRDQFLRRSRLDALGAVAAGLAHELNQPLAAAANFLAAMRIEAVENGNAAMFSQTQRAEQQVAHAGTIIRRLRTFLSGEDRTPEWLAVGRLVDEALALALPGGERRLTSVALAIEPELHIFADRVQLQQALVNVIHNAISAMAEVPRDERRIAITGIRRDGLVEIAISDTGPGFPAGLLDHSHLPFLPAGQTRGLGLGLSICRHILTEQDGKVALANGVGGGAVVRFLLPAEPGDGT